MVTRHTKSGITWIDMESPTRTELESVVAEYGISARVEEEIISPTPYPLVLSESSYVYLILHFPTPDPQGGAKNQEIDFIVGKNFLITVRYEVIHSIHTLHRVFEAEELLGLPSTSPNADELTERIMRQLYSAVREQTEENARTLDRIEEDMFSGKERSTVLRIALAGRVLLRFHTVLTRHHAPLTEFLSALESPDFFGSSFRLHGKHIEAELIHATSLVDSYRAVAMELRQTNDMLLSTSQNEIIKRLTIISAVAFPLSVTASIFGIEAPIPYLHTPYAFWAILAFMLILGTSLVILFRKRKWF